MIRNFAVDVPDFPLSDGAGDHRAAGAIGRQHRMILIAVVVHAASADGVQFREPIQEGAYLAKLTVRAEVCGICLGTRTNRQAADGQMMAQPYQEFPRVYADRYGTMWSQASAPAGRRTHPTSGSNDAAAKPRDHTKLCRLLGIFLCQPS